MEIKYSEIIQNGQTWRFSLHTNKVLKIFSDMAGVRFRLHLNDHWVSEIALKTCNLDLVPFQCFFSFRSFKLVHQVLKLIYIKPCELLALVILVHLRSVFPWCTLYKIARIRSFLVHIFQHLQGKSPYSVQTWENTGQKKFWIRTHFTQWYLEVWYCDCHACKIYKNWREWNTL